MVLSETLSCPADLRALAEVNISPGRKQVATWLCRRLALSASTVLLGNFWGFFQTHFAHIAIGRWRTFFCEMIQATNPRGAENMWFGQFGFVRPEKIQMSWITRSAINTVGAKF